MATRGSNKKIANSLMAVSSAAVLAAYSAGFARTRPVADRFEARAAQRRQADPRPARAESAVEPGGRAMLPASPAAREDTSKPELIASVEPAPAPAGAGLWKDGTYYGWGYSPHGDIQGEVYIEGGRIVGASISDCRTRYSCSAIDKLPPQVARRQSPEVDYVTGATESAEAFYDAVKEALSKAK